MFYFKSTFFFLSFFLLSFSNLFSQKELHKKYYQKLISVIDEVIELEQSCPIKFKKNRQEIIKIRAGKKIIKKLCIKERYKKEEKSIIDFIIEVLNPKNKVTIKLDTGNK